MRFSFAYKKLPPSARLMGEVFYISAIFFVYVYQPLEHKVLIQDDLSPAQRRYKGRQASGGYHRAFLAHFFFNPFYHAVYAGGIKIHQTAFYAVHRIGP